MASADLAHLDLVCFCDNIKSVIPMLLFLGGMTGFGTTGLGLNGLGFNGLTGGFGLNGLTGLNGLNGLGGFAGIG